MARWAEESEGETRVGLLNILCPGLAREYRVPLKLWYRGIYLFIDIAHFPLGAQAPRGEFCLPSSSLPLSLSLYLFVAFPAIISGITICTSVLYIYTGRARLTCRALSCVRSYSLLSSSTLTSLLLSFH